MNRRDLFRLPIFMAVSALSMRPAPAALIPPLFVDCVVAIGFSGPGVMNGVPVAKMWHTIGTGFFYGKLFKDDPDITKRIYSTYLVTAKHVIASYNNLKRQNKDIPPLSIRINPTDASSQGKEFDVLSEVADEGAVWVDSPSGKDVTVISINLGGIRDKKYESMFFTSDAHSEKISELREAGVSAGDGVFVLGFPMDLAGIQRNYVIARHGIIARIDEMLDKASPTFLIDAFVFPGNSGGPVILEPNLASITGTKPQFKAMLIGMVIESVEYDDTAISQQTGRARITFEENSGLAVVIPVDSIEETVMVASPPTK